MNSLIYGSGFGLYGYLPAIYKFSTKIFLNKKYRVFFNSRSELAKFKSRIVWYENINNTIHKIDYLVIAKRPSDQSRIIKSLLRKNNKIKHFFLEKPISSTPKKTINLLKILYTKKINFSVGFLFEYTSWAKLIKKHLSIKKKNKIFIKWNILKKINSTKSWKYNFNEGGGLLRYYGIHLIKLFSDFNFDNIEKNKINKNYWELKIQDNKKNSIRLMLKYSKTSNFSYKINNAKFNKLHNPFFNKIHYKSIDPRCLYLKKYIHKNLSNNNVYQMRKFMDLWCAIESDVNTI